MWRLDHGNPFKLHANDHVIAETKRDIQFRVFRSGRVPAQSVNANELEMQLDAGKIYYFPQNIFQGVASGVPRYSETARSWSHISCRVHTSRIGHGRNSHQRWNWAGANCIWILLRTTQCEPMLVGGLGIAELPARRTVDAVKATARTIFRRVNCRVFCVCGFLPQNLRPTDRRGGIV